MRIISKFRDYYDSVQGYGQDDELVYVRNKFEENTTLLPMLSTRHGFRDLVSRPDRVEQKMVGFCGKIYPVVHMEMGSVEKFCYTKEEVHNFVMEYWDKPRKEMYLGHNYGYRYYSPLITRRSLQLFFEDVKVKVDSFKNLVEENNCPIFIAEYGKYYKDPNKIVYNARLKDVGFYRLFDSYTAYQEISMYLGGVLGLTNRRGKPTYQGEKMDDTVSDKDMITAKGFDKYSFRKDKE